MRVLLYLPFLPFPHKGGRDLLQCVVGYCSRHLLANIFSRLIWQAPSPLVGEGRGEGGFFPAIVRLTGRDIRLHEAQA